MISVVMFASKIVVLARPNPFRIAILIAAPLFISSRMRSKINTLASTDIPTVRTSPAKPGRVNVALKAIIRPNVSSKLASSAKQATMPEKR